MTMLPQRSTWVLMAVFALTLLTYLMVRPAAAAVIPATQTPVTSNRTEPVPRPTVRRTTTAPPAPTTTPTRPEPSTSTFAPTPSPTFTQTPSPTFAPTTTDQVPPTETSQPTSSDPAPTATPT
jgi:hypothetical protein